MSQFVDIPFECAYRSNVSSKPALAEPTSLQDARKAFTRTHICNAARELFFTQGYAATTFDQIAAAAGTRRTTLYSHFRDKAEILEQIATEYQDGLCALTTMLEGPVPSRDQIDAWIEAMVRFVVRERTPASIVIGLFINHAMPEALLPASERLPLALAEKLPAFRNAFACEARNQRTLAWAKAVLRELSLACLQAANEESGSAEALAVAADLFAWFAKEHA